MSKGRMVSERVARLQALFDAGDHGAVRRLAGEIQSDAASGAADRPVAAELLARIAPDRLVVVAGAAGVATAVAIAVWLLSR